MNRQKHVWGRSTLGLDTYDTLSTAKSIPSRAKCQPISLHPSIPPSQQDTPLLLNTTPTPRKVRDCPGCGPNATHGRGRPSRRRASVQPLATPSFCAPAPVQNKDRARASWWGDARARCKKHDVGANGELGFTVPTLAPTQNYQQMLP